MGDKKEENMINQPETENRSEESGLNEVLEMINAKGNARKIEDAVKDEENKE
ncbi:hypothetical protein QUF84_10215 [Fictibacillus enclensis]|uniref:hypothetical protein n=1 Tax=Fictibacillus TaxID=1329200 RepID=UPI000815CF7C|nr:MULTISPECIES: hypothetical protein [Fictibacillus]MDM5198388.1 hypothetical protein [Fictibacillus enclensis]MDM5337591.1 hypothetical protein [Fictibacillus enclensis]WHY73959.1 hypothetical protein QNH15_08690 [Fictibacillus enclensis]SCB83124.1 hypothetical protein GA0061096_0784 [Fictibacillus enclensis]